MADVQPERHFLRLHRDILTALCAVQISNTALRVALAVVRASYGFNEPTTGKRLHIDALLGLTGVRSSSQVRRALRELEDCGIIEATMRPVVGSRLPVEYGLVKDWESWARLPARWSMPWREGGDTELLSSPNFTVPRTPEYLDTELLSTSTPNSRVPLDRRDEKRDEKRGSAAREGGGQQRRGPDPSLRSSTAWESITPTGAAPVARDIEGIATSIWRRTLSLSDAMHLERRGKSGEDFIPPPGQLDPITALVLVNDDATLDAAVKRAQGADKPRAFLMAMADENGRISLRAPSHAAAEQSALVPRPAVDAEKWWRFTEGLRCVVGDFVDCGRCASDLDAVVDLAGSLAPEFGVVLPPDDAIRPVIGAWLAKRAAS